MDLTPVNFFVFYKHDDEPPKHVLNLGNYNKDGSPEAPHQEGKVLKSLPGYSWRRRWHEENKGAVNRIYLAFDHESH